jgi:hypothetical protein
VNRFLSLALVILVCSQALAANELFVSATSMGASFNSAPIDVHNNRDLSIQEVVSAATVPVGSFKLQASNDKLATPLNWTDIPGTDHAVSAAENFMWVIHNPGYRRLRLVYTRTSGTATCNARVELKESGVPTQ